MYQQPISRLQWVLLCTLVALLVILGIAARNEPRPKEQPWSADLFFRVKEAMKNGQPGKRVILYTHDHLNALHKYEHEGRTTCDVNPTEQCTWWAIGVNKIVDGQVTPDLAYLTITIKHTDRLEDVADITVKAIPEEGPLTLSTAEPVATTPGSLFDRVVHIHSPEPPH